MKGLCGVGGDLFGDVWDDIEREQREDMCVHTCPQEIQNYLWEVSGRPKMRGGPPDLGKLTRNRGPRSVSDALWEIQNDLREGGFEGHFGFDAGFGARNWKIALQSPYPKTKEHQKVDSSS